MQYIPAISEGKTPGKKPRTPKGSHTSKNAYMLVYRKRDSLDPASIKEVSLEELPFLVRDHVEKDNEKYHNWVKEMTFMRDNNVLKGKAKQQEVHEVYKIVPTKNDVYELISTKWLTQWLAAETIPAPAVDNSQLLCSHGRLSPNKVTKMKCISRQAAEILYTKYGGGSRLSKKNFCWKCVEKKCREIHLKVKVDEDSRVIAEVLKVKNMELSPEECHWIGKRSLRSWKRLVKEQIQELESDINGTADTDGETPIENSSSGKPLSGESIEGASSEEISKEECTENNEDTPSGNGNGLKDGKTDDKVSSQSRQNNEKEKISDDDDGLRFNEDLTCDQHGGLSMDESLRRLIPSDVWKRLQSYFPDCPEFPGTCSVCVRCLREFEETQRRLEESKCLAATQKSTLSNLFYSRHRPVWSKNISQLMVINGSFVDMWRTFLRDPTRPDQLTEINNRMLLCDHGGFLYEPAIAGFDKESENYLTLLWPEEWKELTKHFKSDVDIQITRIEEEQQVTYISEPDVCKECLQSRQAAYHAAMLVYDEATIYVRKVIDDKGKVVGSKVKDRGGGCMEDDSPGGSDDKGKDSDPEFVQENGKRRKMDASATDKAAKLDIGVRRSSRHRRQRGEKEVVVSSTQTLWELKIQVMKLFSAAPMDQHLMLDEVELKGDKQPLHSFNVLPESVLYLRVDEPCDPMFLDDVTKAQHPEVGFKGTGLLGRS